MINIKLNFDEKIKLHCCLYEEENTLVQIPLSISLAITSIVFIKAQS